MAFLSRKLYLHSYFFVASQNPFPCDARVSWHTREIFHFHQISASNREWLLQLPSETENQGKGKSTEQLPVRHERVPVALKLPGPCRALGSQSPAAAQDGAAVAALSLARPLTRAHLVLWGLGLLLEPGAGRMHRW